MDFVYKKIRELRIVKKLTQSEVAKAMGMTTQGYQNIESGRNNISLNRLEQVAQVLGVSYFELLGANSDCSALEKKNNDLKEQNDILQQHLSDSHNAYNILRGIINHLYSSHEMTFQRLEFAIRLLKDIDDDIIERVYHNIAEQSENPERWKQQLPISYLTQILETSRFTLAQYKNLMNAPTTPNPTESKLGEVYKTQNITQ